VLKEIEEGELIKAWWPASLILRDSPSINDVAGPEE
jgi:hypothetical protein